MKTVRFAAVAVTALAIALLAAGMLMPNRWSVNQQISIAANPEQVRPFFVNLKRWDEWLPKQEGAVRRTFAGPVEGVGASSSWLSMAAGQGRMTIIESTPHQLVLDEAIESTERNGRSTIVFADAPQGTDVSWTDEGMLPRPFGVFFKSEIEQQLTEYLGLSLAHVKSLAEARAAEQRAKAQAVPVEPIDAGTP